MEIQDALKFVSPVITGKTVEASHVVIDNGQLRASNGIVSMGCPVDVPLSCAPQAAGLQNALRRGGDVVALQMSTGGRLQVHSGRLRATVPCLPVADLPVQRPTGQAAAYDGAALRDALEVVLPFASKDTLRPWANGVLLKGQSVYATNNVCVVEYWLGEECPIPVNVPLAAVAAVVKHRDILETIFIDQHSISFVYQDGSWIRTLLLAQDWPDLTSILDRPSTPAPIPSELYDALRALKGFGTNVRLENGLAIAGDPHDDGATYEIGGLAQVVGRYQTAALAALEDVATSADFSLYPAPMLFYGDRLRGAIAGMSL